MNTKTSFINKSLVKTSLSLAVAFVIAIQGGVTGTTSVLALTAAEKEAARYINSSVTEINTKIASLQSSTDRIKADSGLPQEVRDQVVNDNDATIKELNKVLADIKANPRSDTDAKAKADAEKKYQYANVQGLAAVNAGSQTGAQKKLSDTADKVQGQIDSAESEGKDTNAAQEALDQIQNLIKSVSSIIASIAALITSLIAGDFSGAMKIFEDILSQLGINSDVLASASLSLGSISGGLSK